VANTKKLPGDTTRVHMTAPTPWVREIDDWRRRQVDLPNLSEAIRRLVIAGLQEERSRGRKERRRFME
jgi:hypothetical protein